MAILGSLRLSPRYDVGMKRRKKSSGAPSARDLAEVAAGTATASDRAEARAKVAPFKRKKGRKKR